MSMIMVSRGSFFSFMSSMFHYRRNICCLYLSTRPV